MLRSDKKGTVYVDRGDIEWAISRAAFVGDNVTLIMHDPRNGDLFAALNHGHFGIKLHRSRDGGRNLERNPAPQYPAMPEGYDAKTASFTGKALEWSLKLIWGLAPAAPINPASCGAEPCPADSSNRKTAATHGNWCGRFGITQARRLGT